MLVRRNVSQSGPACWLDTPDRSSSSAARVVQGVWDVYRDELGVVPAEVVLALRDAVSRSPVDNIWSTWSHNVLFQAHCKAGGPTEAGTAAFLGRGLLRIRSWRLGGEGGGSRAVGRSGAGRQQRVCHSGEVDVGSAQYLVNSTLAPVLFFRRRLKSVADGLKGIRSCGFT